MKKSLHPAAFAAILVGSSLLCPLSAVSAAGPNGHNIAVVDVSIVFKEHARFKAMMDRMKKEVDAVEADLKVEYTRLKALDEEIKQLNPNSPEYKTKFTAATEAQSKFQVKTQLQKKDFLERESKIYYQVYRELDDAVRVFATKHNIHLVLRYASEPVNSEDRNDILRGINKPIVYVDPALDITRLVLNDLNRSAAGLSERPGPVGVKPR